MRRILIFGATSAIAEATAREFAQSGDALFLAGRDSARLAVIADDLRLRGAATVSIAAIAAHEHSRFPALIDEATRALAGLDHALIAHGVLPDPAEMQSSIAALLDSFDVNCLSVIALCSELGKRFEAQGYGTLAVISSVAGDRGRASNYAYGAAKAAVSVFASGLRQRLHGSGVRVITIKPGPVATPMTAALRQGMLIASSARVAREIARAMRLGIPVLYTPWYWRPIMAVIRMIPERLFRRLRL